MEGMFYTSVWPGIDEPEPAEPKTKSADSEVDLF